MFCSEPLPITGARGASRRHRADWRDPRRSCRSAEASPVSSSTTPRLTRSIEDCAAAGAATPGERARAARRPRGGAGFRKSTITFCSPLLGRLAAFYPALRLYSVPWPLPRGTAPALKGNSRSDVPPRPRAGALTDQPGARASSRFSRISACRSPAAIALRYHSAASLASPRTPRTRACSDAGIVGLAHRRRRQRAAFLRRALIEEPGGRDVAGGEQLVATPEQLRELLRRRRGRRRGGCGGNWGGGGRRLAGAALVSAAGGALTGTAALAASGVFGCASLADGTGGTAV